MFGFIKTLKEMRESGDDFTKEIADLFIGILESILYIARGETNGFIVRIDNEKEANMVEDFLNKIGCPYKRYLNLEETSESGKYQEMHVFYFDKDIFN